MHMHGEEIQVCMIEIIIIIISGQNLHSLDPFQSVFTLSELERAIKYPLQRLGHKLQRTPILFPII